MALRNVRWQPGPFVKDLWWKHRRAEFSADRPFLSVAVVTTLVRQSKLPRRQRLLLFSFDVNFPERILELIGHFHPPILPRL